MNTSETYEARIWDSEKRNSPYSTVADPNETAEDCDVCGSHIDYSKSDRGVCRCDY